MLQPLPKGEFALNFADPETRIRAFCQVQLAGEAPLRLDDFDAVRSAAGEVAGMPGVIQSALCRADGLEVERQFFRSADSRWRAIRLTLANRRPQPIQLDGLFPLRIEGQAAIVISGASFADWRVLRMARHKNDIPGSYRTGHQDADWSDAAFRSGEVVAGMGVSSRVASGGALSSEMLADPGLCIRNASALERPGLFIGAFGQTEHLTSVRISLPDGDVGNACMDAFCEYDGAQVDPGQSRTTHWIFLRMIDDERAVLEEFAELLARAAGLPVPPPTPTVYCSWYFYGLAMTQADLEENLAVLAERPVPIDAVLIDNGWMDNFGSWNANDLWPRGMAHAAETIRRAGYEPGLWTCPFVIMANSPVLQRYPDLAARDTSGNPCTFGYKGPVCYVLDPTAPSVPAYFQEMFRRFRDWGFRYHKFDFLRAIITASNVRFHDPHFNRAQAYRRGMELIRQAVGADAYILACGGLFEGNIGIADAVRSGCDVTADWARPNYAVARSGLLVAIKQNVMRSYLNRFWHTDPDAAMLRLRSEPFRGIEKHRHLSVGLLDDEEAFTIVANQYLGGGLVCISERFAELSESRRALLRHIIPAGAGPARPLNPHAPDCPDLFLTEIAGSPALWWTLAVVNWSEKTAERRIPLAELGLPGARQRLALFELKEQKFLGIREAGDSVALSIPRHGVRVLRLAPWGGDAPVILGTDLHLSGGSELRDVEISAGAIAGRVETPWDYPAIVTAGFPNGSGVAVRSVETTPGERAFRISLNQAQRTRA